MTATVRSAMPVSGVQGSLNHGAHADWIPISGVLANKVNRIVFTPFGLDRPDYSER